ncbi:MAG TPA: hypothetical protein VLX58_19740 [Bryobacteraceae bacterium]|nr:hypothetical protein [Bryobacteraceae bacterium]HUJ23781.1 hypothetical protein [Bryobacteraceae bacterium]
MARERTTQILQMGMLVACVGVWPLSPAWAQAPKTSAATATSVVTMEQPDAQRTREEFSRLLDHYPPTLRSVLALDPGLLGNSSYLAPYPALVSFLNAHPEIARNPAFYVGDGSGSHLNQDHATQVVELWRDVLNGLAAFAGFGMGIALLVWLIRTLVDYRRWSRLAKVQTEAHTKLLDRFTANDDLLAYIQSPAGSKFLQSSPIALDAGPRAVAAPLGRILWSVQGGLVLMAGGIGLQVVSGRVADDASQPLHVLGVLAIALGLGFVISAIISFVISQRLGLIETPSAGSRAEPPAA